MTPITRPCPHCGRDHDISTRIHGDRVWCRFCGQWFAVVMRLDGSVYLSKCDAPDGTQPARETTTDAALVAELSAMRAELEAARREIHQWCKAADRHRARERELRDALERLIHMAECDMVPGPNTLRQARAAIEATIK